VATAKGLLKAIIIIMSAFCYMADRNVPSPVELFRLPYLYRSPRHKRLSNALRTEKIIFTSTSDGSENEQTS